MADAAVDFLLDYLMQIINSDHKFVLNLYEKKLIEKDQIEWVHGELQFLAMFMKDSEEKSNEHKQVKRVVTQVIKLSNEIAVFIDLLVLKNVTEVNGGVSNNIGDVVVQEEDGGTSEPVRECGAGILKNFSWKDLLVKWRRRFETKKSTSLDEKMKTVLGEIESDLAAGMIRHDFDSIMKDIKSIKNEVMEIYKKKKYSIRERSHAEESSKAAPSNIGIGGSPMVVEEDIIVGIDDEKMAIIDLLTAEHEKQLKIISIVGMPGLGKTALARLVYNDPFVVYHFYIRAWTFVSQIHRRRDMLADILCSGFKLKDYISQMGDKNLGEELYKRLKGRRYLIIMDDIWNIDAWNEVKTYFPNDNNGSRVIFTSRLVVVASHAQTHYLRFLNESESWDLLQRKTFRKECCPQELIEIGKEIAKKCQGLPLAILIISGLLANGNRTKKWWKQVAGSVSSYIVTDPNQYMDTLALSYDFLPRHLKACFLYFGAFPEDYEINVCKLIWLLIAEGLIRLRINEPKSLEEVAEDYLKDLINRSLVVVSKTQSDGRIKTCRIHDLLRDLCLRKAHEENFLQQISRNQLASFLSSVPFENKQHRISIHSSLVPFISLPNKLHVRSFLSFGPSFYGSTPENVPFVFKAFKLLRVLDLPSLILYYVPTEITLLIHLRYLALSVVGFLEFHLSISNLWNLETLVIQGQKGSLVFSDCIWKMVKLRHLYTNMLIRIPVPDDTANSFLLHNLQTLCKVELSDYHSMEFLRQFPNLKKLEYHGHMHKLDFLIHLETLKVDSVWWAGRDGLQLKMFPPTLRCLTLSSMELAWQEMSTLGSLPNLEVLKLLAKAFMGARWDTSDGGFRKLRFLKFQRLGIVQWNASSQHFPNLQTLVLDDCSALKDIPPSFGNIPTLDTIRLRYCSQSAETSAKQIQEQQLCMGNDGLKILIDSVHDTV